MKAMVNLRLGRDFRKKKRCRLVITAKMDPVATAAGTEGT
jgi:hypothetical protein